MIRGYLGWLLTNPLFLEEHRLLWENSAKKLAGMNLPQTIEARRSGAQLPDGWQFKASNEADVALQFRDFCSRWLLSEFAGPYLPKPLEARIPRPFSTPGAAPQIQLPATIAIEGRGLIRDMIAECQREAVAEHLEEWMRIIGPDNKGRKTIYRYERIFEVQHFGRAFALRHPKALVGNKERLRDAFARFFVTSSDTIRGDLKLLRQRLTRGHFQAPAWLDAI